MESEERKIYHELVRLGQTDAAVAWEDIVIDPMEAQMAKTYEELVKEKPMRLPSDLLGPAEPKWTYTCTPDEWKEVSGFIREVALGNQEDLWNRVAAAIYFLDHTDPNVLVTFKEDE